MKTQLLLLLTLACASCLLAEEIPYQDQLQRLRDKRDRLATQKHDWRPGARPLSPAEEDDRLRLTTQANEFDPMGVLMDQLTEEIRVLISLKPLTEADAALAEERKEFLALAAGVASSPKSLKEAEEMAATLRGYILRKDMAGFKTFARSKD